MLNKLVGMLTSAKDILAAGGGLGHLKRSLDVLGLHPFIHVGTSMALRGPG